MPVPADIVVKLHGICQTLPDVVEEKAWSGVRWMIGKKHFAHVLMIRSGWPSAYASALGNDGPLVVLTFHLAPSSLSVHRYSQAPFFRPGWLVDIVGVRIDHQTDWDEVAQCVTESYCRLAPKTLATRVRQPVCGDRSAGEFS